jgi:hypothetical protein
MVILVGKRALLQRYGGPERWSAPCAAWYERKEGPSCAPEVFDFAVTCLGGAHPHIVMSSSSEEGTTARKWACRRTVVARIELASPSDVAKAVESVDASDVLRLFDEADLDAVEWAKVGCGSCGGTCGESLEERYREAVREVREDLAPGPLRRPWQRHGWIPAAHAWIAANAPFDRRPASFSTHTVKNWAESCVLHVRVAGSEQRFWFKASPLRSDSVAGGEGRAGRSPADVAFQNAFVAPVSNEASLHAHLSERFPEVVARVHAVEPAKGWMLMEDASNLPMDAFGALAQRRFVLRAVASYGQLQRATGEGDALRELFAAGARDMRPRRLPAMFARVLSSRAALDGFSEFSKDRTLVDEMQRRCDALERRCRSTLVHSDLHGGNVLVRSDGGARILDFGDAVVSCPLFDDLTHGLFGKLGASLLERRYYPALGLTVAEGRALTSLSRPLRHVFVRTVGGARRLDVAQDCAAWHLTGSFPPIQRVIQAVGQAESSSSTCERMMRWATHSCHKAATHLRKRSR